MTGRGKVHLTPGQSKFTNAAIFSIRYFKSQVDVLTAHAFDKKMSGFAKKKAAQNLLRIVGVIGGVMAVSKMLDPDSVELDPRSGRSGKIWVGKNNQIAIPITAGLSGLVTLASRLIPTKHKGVWGQWYVTSNGKYINMWKGKFGQMTPEMFILRFFQGKASPAARSAINILTQKTWDGSEPTIAGEVGELLKPISATNAWETLQKTEGEGVLLRLILSGLDILGAGTRVEDKKTKKKPKWK